MIEKCPKCGSDAEVVVATEYEKPKYFCKCQKCGCRAENCEQDTVPLAIATWDGSVSFYNSCRKHTAEMFGKEKSDDDHLVVESDPGMFAKHVIRRQDIMVISRNFPLDHEVTHIDVEDGAVVKDITIDTKEKMILVSYA